MTAVVSDPSERAALQQRVLRVLTLGQVVGGAALASAVTGGAFDVQDILGHGSRRGQAQRLPVTTTGTAFMPQVVARKTSRHGRCPGLRLGYGLAAVGGGIAAVGVETGSLTVFIVCLFLFGNGQVANLLARDAATDLGEPDERSRAISRIVFPSTFEAVLGPILIGPPNTQDNARSTSTSTPDHGCSAPCCSHWPWPTRRCGYDRTPVVASGGDGQRREVHGNQRAGSDGRRDRDRTAAFLATTTQTPSSWVVV
jgi:hypothetical protein